MIKVFKLIFILVLVKCSFSARILAIMPTPSYSHQIVFYPFWQQLIDKGHHLTLLTTDPLKNHNYSTHQFRQIDLHFAYNVWFNENNFTEVIINYKKDMLTCMDQFNALYDDVIDKELNSQYVKELIRDDNEFFNLVIAEFYHPAMFAFSKRFGCPLIGVAPMNILNVAHELLGNAISPALYTDLGTPFDAHMNFLERLINTVYYVYSEYYFEYHFYPKVNRIVQKHFWTSIPSVKQLQKNVSLILLNTNSIIHDVRPMMPNVITIGSAAHLHKKTMLSDDLRTFLDNAKLGAIYFSLGTNVKASVLSPQTIENIVQALSEVPYKVLWKFDYVDAAKNHSNILIKTWVPQQEILSKYPN